MIRQMTTYVCDVCGNDFRYKSSVEDIKLVSDGIEKFHLDHVCTGCRHSIYVGFGRVLKELRS